MQSEDVTLKNDSIPRIFIILVLSGERKSCLLVYLTNNTD